MLAVTALSVRRCVITSTSGIRSTGLKKCIPMNRSGRRAACAISAIGIEEVFEARIASGATRSSRREKTSRLTSSRSTTASTTRSAARKPVQSTAGEIAARRAAASRASIRPRAS